MYKIVIVLNTNVKVVEQAKTYVESHELLQKLKEKHKGKIVETSIMGSDNENSNT